MGILANGAFTLGLMGLISACCAMGMLIYLYRLRNEEGQTQLKSVLLHLMISWFCYYSVTSFINFYRVFATDEIVQINDIRLIIAALIFFQLTALYRIYLYIKK